MPVLDVLSSVFGSVWGLFSGVIVPGLNVSFSALFISTIIIKVSITFVSHVFGFGVNGTSYRSGSAKNPKISKERKGDDR